MNDSTSFFAWLLFICKFIIIYITIGICFGIGFWLAGKITNSPWLSNKGKWLFEKTFRRNKAPKVTGQTEGIK